MGKTLYLECNSGISGDMTVAALLDLGADEKVLLSSLESLQLDGYQIKIGRTKKCGIDACDFDVILQEEDQGHSHSHDNTEMHEHFHNHDNVEKHEYSHSHDNRVEHEHSHSHDNRVEHEHSHTHDNGEKHGHEHRNIKDVYEIIDRLKDEDVRNLSKKIFEIVAKAEAKAHAIPLEEVHFHEVGAVDSIVDIVAVAICIKNLGITEVIVSPLAEGSGTVWCQHGIIPVPVPAVLNIAIMNELTIKSTNNKGEMITPTGAAIAAALRTKDALPNQYIIKKIGNGAGKKEFATANIVRAILIEEKEQGAERERVKENLPPVSLELPHISIIPQNREKNNYDIIWKLESNIDDCTGEALGYTMEKLLEVGARDVFYTPIYMKKNRPAYLLSVLCMENDIEKMEDIIFTQTTTIGIRRIAYERTILDREIVSFETTYGNVKAKLCKRGEHKICYPEYESVRQICNKEKLEFQQVYASIIHQYHLKYDQSVEGE